MGSSLPSTGTSKSLLLALEETLPFSLDLCLRSGQTFGWRAAGHTWIGTVRDAAFVLRQRENRLVGVSSEPPGRAARILGDYFVLDGQPAAILRRFPDDSFLSECVRACPGLRILEQDPWECLAGFILSSTKRIDQIQQVWQRIAREWGRTLLLTAKSDPPFQNGREHVHAAHSFPEPMEIARLTEPALRACGTGFRAPYLLAAARAVAEGRLDFRQLRRSPLPEVRERLMKMPGVGPKIADCVALFSLGHHAAFPVDTWIGKVLRRVYFRRKRRPTLAQMEAFAARHFGPYAGHAQQYLFHHARMNPEKFRER